MIDLSEKVKGIRFEREREFALAFFDHDKWVHEPRYFYLSDGTKYLPDFYDAKRDAYIEVVGTRQAYSNNKQKYQMFCQEYKGIQLEFRLPDGGFIEQKNGRLSMRTVKKKGQRRKILKNMAGASRLQDIVDAKGFSVEQVSKMCGISVHTVNAHYYGLRKGIRLEIAAKYATGLGIGIADLLFNGDAA